jgi:hypothetical protein
MFERSERALKILCGVIGVLVLYRLVLVIVHINPLYHVTIPQLPSLPSATVETANATNSSAPSAMAGTNGVRQASAAQGTNHTGQVTNLVSGSSNLVGHATNAVALATNKPGQSTNLLARSTNSVAQATNALAHATNSTPASRDGNPGPIAAPPPELARMGMPPGRMARMPPGAFPGMPPGGMPGMPSPGPPLPPELQSRIDRVIDSEILAPVMRPMPMALLGIAGNSIFFRAPNGQTSLIKEGEESGGVKLLRIGVNRVLVEEQGEQKELTIFAGLGGESLLSTQKNSPK